VHSYFPTVAEQWTPHEYPWTTAGAKIDTPFVSTPGLATAQCVADGAATYLAISINAHKDDIRTHDVPGDLVLNGEGHADWGLHRIDVAIAQGDLIDIVGRQGHAYAAQRR
jgi:hypothetical protein